MTLMSLTYVSSASELLAVPQLFELLADIRPRNASLGLTGLLLYSGGNIIQVLEGPESAVESTFTAIRGDCRHKDVIVMLREPLAERAFPDWSMGFADAGRVGVPRVDGLSAFLREPLAAELDGHAEPAYHLLRMFRETVR